MQVVQREDMLSRRSLGEWSDAIGCGRMVGGDVLFDLPVNSMLLRQKSILSKEPEMLDEQVS